MSTLNKRIFIELEDGLFTHLKHRTEMLLRGNPQISTEIVITDRDKELIERFFEDMKSEFQNELGIVGSSSNHPGNKLIIEMTARQQEAKTAQLQGILLQAAQEYLLMRWLDALNLLDLSNFRRAVYTKLLNDFKQNSTNMAFVVPKYRPYF